MKMTLSEREPSYGLAPTRKGTGTVSGARCQKRGRNRGDRRILFEAEAEIPEGSEMDRRRFPMWTGVLLLACAVGVQADTIVAPNANASTNGGTQQYGVFGNNSQAEITFQWDTAASQLTSLVGEDITGIGFAFPGGLPPLARQQLSEHSALNSVAL
jgi:hypothetical protein